eukprot:160397-Chlamydomonas_euryale.AAC.2
MHAAIDALEARMEDDGGRRTRDGIGIGVNVGDDSARNGPGVGVDGRHASDGGVTVRLTDVCFKPFGGACATQSLAQYWAMDRAKYEAAMAPGGKATPEYCFDRWERGAWCVGQGAVWPHNTLQGP